MLEKIRHTLASPHNLFGLLLLGLLCGLFAGVMILLFRLSIEVPQWLLFAEQGIDAYESLPGWARILLPTGGGVLIGLLFHFADPDSRKVGIVHIMERLAYFQGHLPWRNALLQFIGGALSIISGHSVGREGPSAHLGAAAASLPGQWLRLPNNTFRVLIACGTATAVGVAFHTPLAGVIFAMEVVMMEYRISAFTPVIFAAAVGTILVYLGWEPLAHWLNLNDAGLLQEGVLRSVGADLHLHGSVLDYIWIISLGLGIGLLATLFTRALIFFARHSQAWPVLPRLSLAGFLVGLCGYMVPEVMGIGYDTMNAALAPQQGELAGRALILALLLIAAMKLLATTLGLGLGLPGGLIGPTLVIGATAGSAFGLLGEAWLGAPLSPAGTYALLGMAAMMGAVLQAPLAAITAVLELTGNVKLILPGLLIIAVANVLARSRPWATDSVFLEIMRARGLDYRHDPLAQWLRSVGVASAMERQFRQINAPLSRAQAEAILQQRPHWLVLGASKQQPMSLLPGADLQRYLQDTDAALIDLQTIPAKRRQLARVNEQADLQEALEVMEKENVDALAVTHPRHGRVYGILTREMLETHYRWRC